MQLIPAIDLKDGRCVRLLQGDFDRETQYADSAATLAARYAALGAQWLHVVDLNGARDGATANGALIEQLTRARSLKLQIGGGVRDLAALERLLAAGAARAVVGSAALREPEQVSQWLERVGAEQVTLAFDVRVTAQGEPRVATHGWREQSRTSLWQAIDRYADRVIHVLCTDIERDGAMSGPNLCLYAEARRRYPRIAWQASGGVRDASDLNELRHLGVAAAISGKALLEQRIRIEEMRPFLPNA
jgi:phosphoribosylformimino-5-aminoimidazole carboxamide ribotide isomerase